MTAARRESPTIHSFSDAYEEAIKDGDQAPAGQHMPSLLLGNGFSIACQPETFSYTSLFERADFGDHSAAVCEIFDEFGTRDFEKVVGLVQSSEKIVTILESPDEPLMTRLQDISKAICDGLLGVLARLHPQSRSEISSERYAIARSFLAKFSSIFTLNYDLLLYWTIVGGLNSQYRKDGFAISSGTYRLWDPLASSVDFYFLHGALHLYNMEDGVAKTTWADTGVQLIEQTRQGLDEGMFPLVVTEGASSDKEEKINNNPYLSRALDKFSKLDGALFSYGFSMSENDDHILDRIAQSRISRIFLSLYGPPESSDTEVIVNRAWQLADRRKQNQPGGPELEVNFYQAETANIWHDEI